MGLPTGSLHYHGLYVHFGFVLTAKTCSGNTPLVSENFEMFLAWL